MKAQGAIVCSAAGTGLLSRISYSPVAAPNTWAEIGNSRVQHKNGQQVLTKCDESTWSVEYKPSPYRWVFSLLGKNNRAALIMTAKNSMVKNTPVCGFVYCLRKY